MRRKRWGAWGLLVLYFLSPLFSVRAQRDTLVCDSTHTPAQRDTVVERLHRRLAALLDEHTVACPLGDSVYRLADRPIFPTRGAGNITNAPNGVA